MLGPSTDQGADQPAIFDAVPEDILSSYAKDFVAAWNATLANLNCVRCSPTSPKYLALSGRLGPDIADRLSRRIRSRRDGADARAQEVRGRPASRPSPPTILSMRPGPGWNRANAARSISPRSRSGRPGEPPAEVPGKSIEAKFKAFLTLVDGDAEGAADRRSDRESQRSSTRRWRRPRPAPCRRSRRSIRCRSRSRACARNVHACRSRSRAWFEKVAKDALGDANAASIDANLGRDGARGDRALPADRANGRYPFAPKATATFRWRISRRLFKPGGVIDAFSPSRLAPLRRRQRQDLEVAADTESDPQAFRTRRCRPFQQAAEIRDAFFPTGGAQPSVKFEVKMLDSEHRRADRRRLR